MSKNKAKKASRKRRPAAGGKGKGGGKAWGNALGQKRAGKKQKKKAISKRKKQAPAGRPVTAAALGELGNLRRKLRYASATAQEAVLTSRKAKSNLEQAQAAVLALIDEILEGQGRLFDVNGAATAAAAADGDGDPAAPGRADREELLATPIARLGLPAGIVEKLARAGIDSVEQLEKHRAEFGLTWEKRIPGIGKAAKDGIERAVEDLLMQARDAEEAGGPDRGPGLQGEQAPGGCVELQLADLIEAAGGAEAVGKASCCPAIDNAKGPATVKGLAVGGHQVIVTACAYGEGKDNAGLVGAQGYTLCGVQKWAAVKASALIGRGPRTGRKVRVRRRLFVCMDRVEFVPAEAAGEADPDGRAMDQLDAQRMISTGKRTEALIAISECEDLDLLKACEESGLSGIWRRVAVAKRLEELEAERKAAAAR